MATRKYLFWGGVGGPLGFNPPGKIFYFFIFFFRGPKKNKKKKKKSKNHPGKNLLLNNGKKGVPHNKRKN